MVIARTKLKRTNIMKIVKMLKIAFVLTVLIISTSCNPEEINPKETNGDSQKEILVEND